MKHFIGFMDESGVLSLSSEQRFFALGLLKIYNTSEIYNKLKIINDEAKNKINPKFEFKFSHTTKNNIKYYKKLINECLNFNEFYFSAIIFDKQNPKLDIQKYFPNTWEAYISFSKLLIRNNLKNNETITIIADYLSKPKNSTKNYDEEIRKVDNIANACMMESEASLFIQVVDIFLGAILYEYKINCNLAPTHTPKAEMSFFLQNKLKSLNIQGNYNNTLIGNFTINKPFYFSCWEFQPR